METYIASRQPPLPLMDNVYKYVSSGEYPFRALFECSFLYFWKQNSRVMYSVCSSRSAIESHLVANLNWCQITFCRTLSRICNFLQLYLYVCVFLSLCLYFYLWLFREINQMRTVASLFSFTMCVVNGYPGVKHFPFNLEPNWFLYHLTVFYYYNYVLCTMK